jgi:hypothetical protein
MSKANMAIVRVKVLLTDLLYNSTETPPNLAGLLEY